MRALTILFLLWMSFCAFSCSGYPYRDYKFYYSYSPPTEPRDTLLAHCDLNPDPACLFTALLENDEEKKMVIADSVAQSSFDSIADWNRNLDFGKYPPNDSVQGSSYTVKDAWLDLVSVHPSVYDEENLLVNETGEVLTRQGFTFVVQNKARRTDCRTEYKVCGYDYTLDTYLGGEKINSGNNEEAYFTLPDYSDYPISSELNIETEYHVDHYHWVLYCDMFSCWLECEYYDTEEVTDSLSLTDSLNVTYNNESNKTDYILDGNDSGVADFWISIEGNDTNVELDVGNANLRENNYFYKIRRDSQPYNALTKEKVPTNRTDVYAFSVLESQIENITKKINAVVPLSDDCTLIAKSHFNEEIFEGICTLSRPEAAIDLNATEEDSELRINIRLYSNESGAPIGNRNLTISHGGQDHTVTTEADGTAELIVEKEGNIVTAEFDTDFEFRSAKKTIIMEPENPAILDSFTNLFSLGIAAYLTYLPIKRVVLGA